MRQKVDPSVAKEACEAVQSKKMTALQVQKAFGISRKSIIRRLNGIEIGLFCVGNSLAHFGVSSYRT